MRVDLGRVDVRGSWDVDVGLLGARRSTPFGCLDVGLPWNVSMWALMRVDRLPWVPSMYEALGARVDVGSLGARLGARQSTPWGCVDVPCPIGALRRAARNAMGAATGAAGISTGATRNATRIAVMSAAKGAATGAARNAMGAATGAAGISTGVARNATWISAMSAAKGAATGAANAMSAATGAAGITTGATRNTTRIAAMSAAKGATTGAATGAARNAMGAAGIATWRQALGLATMGDSLDDVRR